jgi:hypothetical protein
MSAVDHTTVTRAFTKAMQTLWPVKSGSRFLLVTNVTPIMGKAAEGLSVSCPKLIHVTCVANALHRVYGVVLVLYPNVYKVVANGREVSFKSPPGAQHFQHKSSGHTVLPNSSNYT